MFSEHPYVVDGRRKTLANEPWNFLVVLDACRYDFFEATYEKYLDFGGVLRKAISPASQTMEWLNMVFPSYYDDVVYVSGNPYVNSKVRATDLEGNSYFGGEHFFKIVDAWDDGWDDNLGTTPPESVTRPLASLEFHKAARYVLHFMQPHEPYVGRTYAKFLSPEYAVRRGEAGQGPRNWGMRVKHSMAIALKRELSRSLGAKRLWNLSARLNRPVRSQPARIYYEQGFEGIRNAYKENLELALQSLAEAVRDHLQGRILVTADHGEYLGEGGRYGHSLVPRRGLINEVPWLEISKDEK